jgi:hypothetical protein
MGTEGSFLGGLSGQGVKLTSHLYLIAEVKNAWSCTSTLPYVFLAWANYFFNPVSGSRDQRILLSFWAKVSLLWTDTEISPFMLCLVLSLCLTKYHALKAYKGVDI